MKLSSKNIETNFVQICGTVAEDMDRITEELNNGNLDASVESVGANLVENVMTSLRRISTAFRDNVANVFTDVERSEMRRYYQVHKAKLESVFDAKFHKLMDEKVFIPQNMQGTYRESLDMILKLYNELNMDEVTQEADKAFNNFYSAVSRGDENAFNHLTGIMDRMMASSTDSAIHSISKQVYGVVPNNQAEVQDLQQEMVERTMQNVVERAKTLEKFEEPAMKDADVKFQKVFTSVSEYQSVANDLLEQEFRVKESKDINDRMVSMTDTIDSVIEMADKGTLNNDMIANLASVIKALATDLSNYGFCIATQMKLEHNFILSNQVLYKSL